MTHKQFNADFKDASQKVAGGGISGIASLTRGDSDGEVVVNCRHGSLPGGIRVQALAQNINKYPEGNTFLLFIHDDDDPPKPILDAIKSAQVYLSRMRLYEMVAVLSSHLQVALNANTTGNHQNQDEEAANESDGSLDEDEDDYDLDDDVFGLSSAGAFTQLRSVESVKNSAQLRQRLRRDLRQANQAGYKVGLMDDLGHSGTCGIASISIRAQKLGLSEQAMEAWDVQDNEYIVLLIRFNTYTPIERVIEQAGPFTKVSFRIGKCTRYKPSFSQALAAFAEIKAHDAREEPRVRIEELGSDAEFRKLFISNSLEQYLNQCFVSLLKLRVAKSCSWDEANSELESRPKGASMADYDGKSKATPQSHGLGAGDPMDIDPAPEDQDHRILASDHLAQPAPEHGRSFPLVAMEFAMHYFVKCTEYCLQCHEKVEKGFEALRPYVCSKPLCLFQYMTMGFGPSIEHEILTEPYVVDLLVSLCYAALYPKATTHGAVNPANQEVDPGTTSSLYIRQLPVGLQLMVPGLHNWGGAPLKGHTKPDHNRIFLDVEPPVFDANGMADRLSPGKWIAYRAPGQPLTKHAVIVDIQPSSKSFTVKHMGESGTNWQPSIYGHINPLAAAPGPVDADLVDIYFYDTDIDSLSHLEKAGAMRHILDTLPRIAEVAGFLKSHPHSSLRSMEGVSPAAASLLQWIVSSNRSCIFQVDASEELARHAQQSMQPGSWAGGVDPSPAATSLSSFEPAYTQKNREHERILGMEGWIQFRFAQGAPDKELRFRKALQEQAARIPIEKNPTIFAWHGSNLSNWHSIVRTGLNFDEVHNGRACGHGVYFSPQHNTSIGYTGGGAGATTWGNSTLNFTTCMSLNEIINATDQFQYFQHGTYVVQYNDWHQCRYLFVKSGRYTGAPAAAAAAAVAAKKDQTWTQKFHVHPPDLQIFGPAAQQLQIPLAAIPFRHVGAGQDAKSTAAKRTSIKREEDESAEEDAEDVEFLFSDGESDGAASPPLKKASSPLSATDLAGRNFRPLTPANTDNIHSDFVPGALDISILATLKPPSFANNLATRALSREMKKLQEIQAKTPLHELGWYMDFDKIANLFQWIVEFHSFEASLPLAQDMKTIGTTSVVLEIRYGKDYPMTPPFVRVIRPRFLNFSEGGGGHVTAGGAMCMELLTNSGWSPANSIESVLLQVRMAMCNLEPRPARLQEAMRASSHGGYRNENYNDYHIGEAVEAYKRAASAHGWSVPSDLVQTANGV